VPNGIDDTCEEAIVSGLRRRVIYCAASGCHELKSSAQPISFCNTRFERLDLPARAQHGGQKFEFLVDRVIHNTLVGA
jgi:hypothetical protein